MLPFPDKFLDFHPPKFLMTFLKSSTTNFEISIFPSISPVSVHSPLFSKKYYFPPYFQKFPPCFSKIHLLFTYFLCISFPPYFDHDAFMHHPMHVLDAPAPILWRSLRLCWYEDSLASAFLQQLQLFLAQTAVIPLSVCFLLSVLVWV